MCDNAIKGFRGECMKTQLSNELLQLFSSYEGVDKVILFGSRARGDHDERSDVDLAIQAPRISDGAWLQLRMAIEEDLHSLLFFDVVKWEEIPAALKNEIKEEGKILYEREKGTVRHFIDEGDGKNG